MISHSKFKYLSSLKIKKFRNLHGQFMVEGDKIISDILKEGSIHIQTIIASSEWLDCNRNLLGKQVDEIIETGTAELEKISSLDTPPPVIAVMNMLQYELDDQEITQQWSLALDTIRDPGNLGTIIRTADWFGIRHVVCSTESVDFYNPKVVQSSMGAIFRTHVHYVELEDILKKLNEIGFPVFGTYMEGQSLYEMEPVNKGIIVFGNESKGISPVLRPFIRYPITIPASKKNPLHIESLNVASSVAVVCSVVSRF